MPVPSLMTGASSSTRGRWCRGLRRDRKQPHLHADTRGRRHLPDDDRGKPREYNNNTGCDFSTAIPTCPFQASSDYAAYFQVQVGDYNLPSLYTAAQIPSFYGMNMWTNIDETGLPPEIVSTPSGNELVLQLADQHEHPDAPRSSVTSTC